MQVRSRQVASTIALLWLVGCGGPGGTGGDSGKASWMPSVPFLASPGEKATMISALKPGAYEASSLAIGEEKDIARQRGEGAGFARSPELEGYLGALRARLVAASGKTRVPGRVMIVANAAFNAYSTPDGNLFVFLGCLELLESADEVAAVLAHELSHVLLTHHSADMVADLKARSQSLYEIGVNAQASLSGSKGVSRSDARGLANVQLAADATDKLVLPAWNRGQEREADLLGVDLLAKAGYAPPAMVTMLEKLRAWEQKTKESEDAFWERVKGAAQRNVGEALSIGYQRLIEAVSVNHPKTDERIEQVVAYLARHYGDRDLPESRPGPWKEVRGRPDTAQLMHHYHLAFAARALLEKGKPQEAYASAKTAASGRTASDAYPNMMLARSASALGRQREAVEALGRAIRSPEPVPQVYEEMIFTQERAGNVTDALSWADRASQTFGRAPRWTPHRIRLLRKTGRVTEAASLMVDCSVNTPDWRRLCQEANQTPAGRAPR